MPGLAKSVVVSPARAVAVMTGVVLLAAAVRFLPAASGPGWLLRIVLASLTVGVIPGMVALLAWRPRPGFGLLELLGYAIGVSLGLTQLLTVAALLGHWGPLVSLACLAGWFVGHGAWATRGGRAGTVVRVGAADLGLLLVLVIIGVRLYVIGSPLDETEERIHISIMQRLSFLPHPSIRNIYLTPEVVYTYPFPGTHYFLALIARLGDIDAAFLYHKMRVFWGPAAIILMYGCAHAIVGSVPAAMAVAFVDAGLVMNGTFGPVPEFFWGQLAPYSHASDVAMGVLLPALMLLTFGLLRAEGRRDRLVWLASTLALVVMLLIVHTREIVQYLVYLTVFAAMAPLLPRESRRLPARAALLVIGTLLVLVVYRLWHSSVVVSLNSVMVGKRTDLADMFRATSWSTLTGLPLPLLRNYMPGMDPLFFSWYPALLLLAPLVLVVLRGRPLVWMLTAGTACYLLIIRLPVLAIPYIYVTYYEILYTPVRNVVLFVHLLGGLAPYVLSARLARHGYGLLVAGALGAAAAAVGAFRLVGPFVAASPDRLFLPAIAGLILVAIWQWFRRRVPLDDAWIDAPRPRWMLALALLLAPVLVGTNLPDGAVWRASWANSTATPAELLARECHDAASCPPPPALIRLAHEQLGADSVFAVDKNNPYQPSLFLPQQMSIWPGSDASLIDGDLLFPRYYAHFNRTQAAFGGQPFFNNQESLAERMAFLRDLGITHVLLNPAQYRLMTGVIAAHLDLFTVRYDDGRWALYEVRRSGGSAAGTH